MLDRTKEAVAERHWVAEAQAVLAAEALRVRVTLAVVEEEVEGDLLMVSLAVLLIVAARERLTLSAALTVAAALAASPVKARERSKRIRVALGI